MPSALELLREGRTEELWQKCCGFIDLSMEEFMAIQRRLLMEQIELLNRCELGNKAMQGAKPRTVEEFREQVPITTYEDYVPYLPEQIESALPEKPLLWQRTSGRRCYSGTYAFKWIPVTERMYRELGDTCLAILLFASCKERGDVVLEEHDKFLYAMAPPPYASGSWAHRAAEEGIFDFLPPLDEAEKMEFEERLMKGFKLASFEGMDLLFALTGLLVLIGEQFSRGGGLKRAIPLLSKPRALTRLLKAVLKSKLARRPLLPRDIWSLKLLVGFGTDTAVYREKLKNMWGRYPLDVYGSTETVMTAMQTWDYGDMTFIPQINFLEFVPEGECHKWLADPSYKPDIFTLDEVKAGEKYGIVITNFYGGAFVRYFLGDVISITSLRNEKLNINIPQMVFYSRVDGMIDIDGLVHNLTEATMWRAIEDSGLMYRDWLVRQERDGKPMIHFYVEPKDGAGIDTDQAAIAIREQLRELDPFYCVLEDMRDLALEVTLLSRGAFRAYMLRQQAAGADLAHLKPPHINPPDDIVDFLLNPVP